jgi:hypothetical protein
LVADVEGQQVRLSANAVVAVTFTMSFSSLAVPWVTFRIRQWLRTAGSCAAPQVRRSTPDAGARPSPVAAIKPLFGSLANATTARSISPASRTRIDIPHRPGLPAAARRCAARARPAAPARERQRRRAAEQRDELAPIHSITSSARPSSGSGTASPSVLAVLLASLARPGGMSLLVPELSGKRLALLKELIPQATRIAVLANPATLVTVQQWKETQEAAQRWGLHCA